MKGLVKRLWQGWAQFGHFVGDYQSRLLLTIFYFSALVPFGIGVRVLADPLHLRGVSKSAWSPRKEQDATLESARHQY